MSDNTETAVAIKNFSGTVKAHTEKKVGDSDKILNSIKQCKSTNPNVFGEERVQKYLVARSEMLQQLLQQYIVARITSRYPILDQSLFKMKRHLNISSGGKIMTDKTKKDKTKKKEVGSKQCEVDLFASVPFDGNRTVEFGGFITRKTVGYTTTTSTKKLSATLPTPPEDIFLAGKSAIGFYYGVIAEIYQSELLCDLLKVTPKIPDLSIIWIPTVDSINVKSKTTSKTVVPKPDPIPEALPQPTPYERIDPAVLLHVGDMCFLVKTYDIEEEQPFEGFMREFTIGDTKGTLKR